MRGSVNIQFQNFNSAAQNRDRYQRQTHAEMYFQLKHLLNTSTSSDVAEVLARNTLGYLEQGSVNNSAWYRLTKVP